MHKNIVFAIGPSKTGTTWLYNNLKKHEEVFTPPIKEIRHFWLKEQNISNCIFHVLFYNHWHHKHIRFQLVFILIRLIRFKYSLKEIKWFVSFFSDNNKTNYYDNLLDNEKITIDVSPQYANVSLSSIKAMKKLYPYAKIIVGLRNPIDRHISRANMIFRAKRVDTKHHEIKQFLSSTEKNKSNNYPKLISKWQQVFGENIFIYYFDQLEANPQRLFNDICCFLNISKKQIKSISEKHNVANNPIYKPEYFEISSHMNLNYIEATHKIFNNRYTSMWLQRCKEILDNCNEISLK